MEALEADIDVAAEPLSQKEQEDAARNTRQAYESASRPQPRQAPPQARQNQPAQPAEAPEAPAPGEEIVQPAPDPTNMFKKRFEEAMASSIAPPEPQPEPVKETNGEHKAEPADDKTWTSPKAADWKKLKAELKEKDEGLKATRAEKEALAARLQEAEKKPAFDASSWDAKVKAADEERAKTTAELERVALERSPRFNGHFQRAIDTAIVAAKEAVGADKAAAVGDILTLPPSAWRKERLSEIIEGLPDYDKTSFMVALNDHDRARKERQAALDDAKTSHSRLQQAEAEQKAMEGKQREAVRETQIDGILKAAGGFESFKPSDDPTHNQFVEANKLRIRQYLRGELSEQDYALMPIAAAEGERLASRVVPALQKENEELKAALAAYQNQSPDLGSRTGDGGSKPSGDKQPSGFIATYKANWPGK